MNRFIFFTLIIIGFPLLLLSCTGPKHVAETKLSMPVKNRLAFISLYLEKDDEGSISLSKQEVQIREVQTKIPSSQSIKAQYDFFILIFLDANQKILAYHSLENPLHKTVEYVDENNQLGLKEINIDEGWLNTRLSLPAKTKYLQIKYTDPEGNQDLIKTIELNQ